MRDGPCARTSCGGARTAHQHRCGAEPRIEEHDDRKEPERIQTVVIGGGQAGLSVGYHLARRKLPFVILNAHERIGDSWRQRWDSLRLFTPARFDGLDGMPFPAPPDTFPTKDEMADYLEAYAARFALPVRNGVEGGSALEAGPSLPGHGRRPAVRGRACRGGDGQLPAAARPGVRPGSRSGHRPAAFARLPQSRPTARRRRPARRRGQLGRRNRARSGACRPSHVDVGTGHRQRPVSPRRLPRPALSHAFRAPVRVPPGVDAEHAARPQGAAQDHPPGRTAHSRQVAATWPPSTSSGCRRWSACGTDARCWRMAACSMSPTSSGAPASIRRPRGSTCRCSPPTASRFTSADRSTNEPGLYFVGQHFLYAMSSTMIHGVGQGCRAHRRCHRGPDRGITPDVRGHLDAVGDDHAGRAALAL